MGPIRLLNKWTFCLLISTMTPFSSQACEEKSFSSPESVLRIGDEWLVSNVGSKLEPTAKDGDGFISRVRPCQSSVKDIFEGKIKLDAPKGMGIYQDILYVADIDRLVGISLTTKRQVLELSFAKDGVGFLNDVAISDAGLLYVSATDTGAIFSVDLTKANPSGVRLSIPSLPGPNGLFLDSERQRLVVASFGQDQKPGEIGFIDLPSNRYTSVVGAHGLYDGISLLDEQNVLVSDWGKFEAGAGSLKRVNLVTGEVKVVREGLSGPADFSISTDGKYLLPGMMSGTLILDDLKP